MNKIINEKLEKLTTFIQSYLNNNPALLIGSGASIPYAIPSMEDLASAPSRVNFRVIIKLILF